jgi:hypothetical protein
MSADGVGGFKFWRVVPEIYQWIMNEKNVIAEKTKYNYTIIENKKIIFLNHRQSAPGPSQIELSIGKIEWNLVILEFLKVMTA